MFRGWKNKKIQIKATPSAEEIKILWSNIWGKNKKYNKDAKRLSKLDKEYCKYVKPKSYKIYSKNFRDYEILGWCPAGPVLPHGEKVPL